MIAAIICLLLGLATGYLRAAVYEKREGCRHRHREIDLECNVLDKAAQIAYLKEQNDGLGAAVNRNAEIVLKQEAHINGLLDQLRERDATITEQARLLALAQQQTRNLPTSKFLYSTN